MGVPPMFLGAWARRPCYGRMSPKKYDAQLQRLHAFKQGAPPAYGLIGPEMVAFFKQSVEKRQTKLSKVAQCWGALVPEVLNEHCALESFSRGNLTVIVDSSSHLYEL